MSGYPWRHPGVLRCPVCIKKPRAWGDAHHGRQMWAATEITKTGRTGKARGRYNRPTVEVRHETCGHVWMTTHFSVQKKA